MTMQKQEKAYEEWQSELSANLEADLNWSEQVRNNQNEQIRQDVLQAYTHLQIAANLSRHLQCPSSQSIDQTLGKTQSRPSQASQASLISRLSHLQSQRNHLDHRIFQSAKILRGLAKHLDIPLPYVQWFDKEA